MKIIISAYDCSPDHGSEAGLGWNWVMAASNYAGFDKIHVITTDRYEKNIKDFTSAHSADINKIVFHFLPLPLSGLRKLNQRIKYIIWQWKVGNLSKELCKKEDINFLHHVTWATCVLPTFLYRGGGGIPFIYGPVGGGERIPQGVDIRMSKRDAFVEWVRNTMADLSVVSPSTRKAFKKATLILAVTEETKNLIPSRYQDKVKVMQAIGLNALPKIGHEVKPANDEFVVLLAARMLCWKGIDIAIEVFRRLEKQNKDIKLLIAGIGRNYERYKNIASELSNVQFLGELPHAKMEELYQKANILLNCSLHDSGCMVVLEAMSYGLPIVAIKTGGPAVLTDEKCAILVEPKAVDQMVDELCESIVILKNDEKRRLAMSKHSRQRAQLEFSYNKKYDQILTELKNIP